MDHADRARRLADDVLFARALETDVGPLVPRDLLDALADEGFYGMAAPAEAGGWGLAKTACDPIIEALASGCLTTTFVWIQHHNVVRAVAGSNLRDDLLEPLAAGRVRSGISRAGERPGEPVLTARRAGADWVLDGEAPWLTGWGVIDVAMLGARHDGDEVVRILVDAAAAPGLTVVPLDLVAAGASGTVVARFDGVRIPADRLVEREPLASATARDPIGLRTNGSLALGIASRCARLARLPDVARAVGAEVDAVRARLDAASVEQLPAARAAAADLAWRAAGALAADQGSRSVLVGGHPQRLAREALFTLVFGTRAAIRDDLIARLVRSSS